ncbi:MAG: immune inhibitor A [Candidatus Bathyarchaeota archaeon]|nr:MAG: immune inhibitor A [Candidatus Bathyarchaeota archaeon]
MSNKAKSIVLCLLLLMPLLFAFTVRTPMGYTSTLDYEPYDIGPTLRSQELPINTDSIPVDAGPGHHSYYVVGDVIVWLALDSYMGYYFFADFQLRALGDVAEIWVQTDLSWSAGDPRPYPAITDEQISYLLEEFESNIYPTDTSYFGTPDYHDGTYSLLEAWGYVPPGYYYEETGRNVVLVSNVRDDNYYDPMYPIYIAGFYSNTFEGYFDRNIINIDSYDWGNRIGPNVGRPYLYEGVIAHEYQHLIHDDLDSDEEDWVNEGCSDYAEFLCGYGHPGSHVEDAAAYPENSLVVWEDQGDLEILSDYGHAYLWTLYLAENYGNPFIHALANNPENGISGVGSTLDAFNIREEFGDLYHDWAVSLLIDSKVPGGGRYSLENIEFNLDIGTPDSPNPEAYDTPGAPPWGTDYIWIDGDPKELAKFTFNGLDYTVFPTVWSSDGSVLWSGTGNLIDNWAIFEAAGGGTLTFDTYYDIEDYWDFGFVQASTEGGHTWTSLEDAYTTYLHDPNAHSKVVENLPGLTGWSGSWVTMSFDLSAYAGQDILLAFRYVTDWNTLYDGWYIDNVYVDGTHISDGSSTDPFKDLTEVLPINNDFTVTIVGIKEKAKGNQYKVLTLKLDEVTEDVIFELNSVLKSSDSAVMLVTFDAPEGFTGYVEYTYDFTYTNSGQK